MEAKDLTKTDLKDAIMDLKGMILATVRGPGAGKIAKVKVLRARKLELEAELATR